MRIIRLVVLFLILIGAINWGLWGVFQYDAIQDVFGSDTSLWARFAYGIIGLAGVYGISFIFSKGTCGYGCACEEKNEE